MNYIFGLGLPRTCTNSLGSALHLMGFDGECKCILNDFHNKREKDGNLSDYKYIIYNDAYQELQVLLSNDKIYNNKYILTVRNNEDWHNSLNKFSGDNVNELQRMDMDKYVSEIKKIFLNKNCINNLLIINVFEEENKILWEKLYNLLKLDFDNTIIETDFPKINLNE